MPRPWRKNFEGAKYHITCRGNARKRIFLAREDWVRFRAQLNHALVCEGVRLDAWALMSNHYHLLVETPRANLPAFMRRLNTSYAMYFRHKHQRPGHCFQGRYGAKLVKDDEYLLRLTRYIHLNPVNVKGKKEKSVEEKWTFLSAFPWSSLRGCPRASDAEEDVSYDWLWSMGRRTLAGCRRAYGAYMRDCLGSADEVLASAYDRSRYAIGEDDFVEGVEEEMREQAVTGWSGSDLAASEERGVGVADLLRVACEQEGVELAELESKWRRLGTSRGMVLELVCRYGGCTQRDLGEVLGVSEHAIGKQRKRFADMLSGDPQLRKQLQSRHVVFRRVMSSF